MMKFKKGQRVITQDGDIATVVSSRIHHVTYGDELVEAGRVVKIRYPDKEVTEVWSDSLTPERRKMRKVS